MKKIVLLFFVLSASALYFWPKQTDRQSINQSAKTGIAKSSGPAPKQILRIGGQEKSVQPSTASLFLPYWNLPEKNAPLMTPSIASLNKINPIRTIYFGITANEQGINQDEAGYQNLPKAAGDKNSLLTLRLTNRETAQKILADPRIQNQIVEETAAIAKRRGAGGVVLDLELSSLPTQTLISQINDFTAKLSDALASFNFNPIKSDLKLAMTLYGDQFYRPRPYDVRFLNKYVDEFFIMVYDFHKVYGSPGPNFPLAKGQRFDYDLQTAVRDFTSIIPAEKLTFVFGMYGYDWTVDEKQRPIKKASSLTLNQIREKFFKDCFLEKCLIGRDESSAETEINYVDDSARLHVVWFEDEVSTAKKIEFLKTKNIVSYAFWAYGYY